jgi:hypothetical protein
VLRAEFSNVDSVRPLFCKQRITRCQRSAGAAAQAVTDTSRAQARPSIPNMWRNTRSWQAGDGRGPGRSAADTAQSPLRLTQKRRPGLAV